MVNDRLDDARSDAEHKQQRERIAQCAQAGETFDAGIVSDLLRDIAFAEGRCAGAQAALAVAQERETMLRNALALVCRVTKNSTAWKVADRALHETPPPAAAPGRVREQAEERLERVKNILCSPLPPLDVTMAYSLESNLLQLRESYNVLHAMLERKEERLRLVERAANGFVDALSTAPPAGTGEMNDAK